MNYWTTCSGTQIKKETNEHHIEQSVKSPQTVDALYTTASAQITWYCVLLSDGLVGKTILICMFMVWSGQDMSVFIMYCLSEAMSDYEK